MMRARVLAAGSAVALSAAGLWAVGGPAVAAPVELFSSSTPGVQSVTVPTGVCFVSVTADGGHGGGGVDAR